MSVRLRKGEYNEAREIYLLTIMSTIVYIVMRRLASSRWCVLIHSEEYTTMTKVVSRASRNSREPIRFKTPEPTKLIVSLTEERGLFFKAGMKRLDEREPQCADVHDG